MRGPHYGGSSTGVASASDAGVSIAWSRRVGVGFSAFVSDGRHVVGQAQEWDGQYVICLDARTGRELWRIDWSTGYDPHPAWPVFRDPFLLCTAPFRRGARCLRITHSNRTWRAEAVWESPVLCCAAGTSWCAFLCYGTPGLPTLPSTPRPVV